MTVTTFSEPDRSWRWLLIGSLALNLFFIGTIGALAVRHSIAPAQPAATERPRTAAARIERIAAPLPAADADKLRTAFRAREAATEGARDALNKAFEQMQAALRAQPFDSAALRTAMAQMRSVRAPYDQAMQEIIMSAAADMSPEGRSRLADWPPRASGNTR
jgi:uncharacterized membrane protein